MNKFLGFVFSVLILSTTTSCVKDWQCECIDGSSKQIEGTYPGTKSKTAKAACESVEENIQTFKPNVTCSIK